LIIEVHFLLMKLIISPLVSLFLSRLRIFSSNFTKSLQFGATKPFSFSDTILYEIFES